jgi:hypothetical protein
MGGVRGVVTGNRSALTTVDTTWLPKQFPPVSSRSHFASEMRARWFSSRGHGTRLGRNRGRWNLVRKSTNYACRSFTCQVPVTEPKLLRALLTQGSSRIYKAKTRRGAVTLRVRMINV